MCLLIFFLLIVLGTIDYVETAVLISFSGFMSEIIVLGPKKPPLFWYSSVYKSIYNSQLWYFFQKYLFEFSEGFCFKVFLCKMVSGQSTGR